MATLQMPPMLRPSAAQPGPPRPRFVHRLRPPGPAGPGLACAVPAAALLARALLALVVSAGLVLPPTLPAAAQPTPSRSQPEAATGLAAKPLVVAERHMVVAASPLAAEAGREVLREGGSAADAVIATLLVLGIVEPQSSGLGGGGLIMHWDAASRGLSTFDGRETAPAAARPDRFLRDGQPLAFDVAVRSGLAVGVPGLARLLHALHGRHGRLPWPRLVEPALRLAETGFPMSPRLVGLLAGEGPARFSAAARRHYFDADGRPRAVGTRLANPELAVTLRRLAAEGPDALHTGPIAAEIVAAVTGAPFARGDMTLADLASFRVVERPPVCAPYRALSVCGFGPPSSGGIAVGQTLALLEGRDLGRGPAAAMNAPALHLVAEALKLAFADRNWWVADPDHIAVPSGLLDAAYLAERRLLLSPGRVMARPFPGLPPGRKAASLNGGDETLEAAGTTHVSIVDGAGNAVSATSTIEGAFGSRLWAAGFLLNNQMTDFSFRPRDRDGRAIANRVEGGKRPRSSMSPTIVLDAGGRPVIVTGSPGGSRIIPYVVKGLVAMIDWELDPAAAAALPNLAVDGNRIVLEAQGSSLGDALARSRAWLATLDRMVALKALGQEVRLDAMTSGLHSIRRRPDGRLEGGADPRREGSALGD